MSGKYGEPWDSCQAGDIYINNMESLILANEATEFHEDHKFSERAVACVNTLEGLNPDKLGDLLRLCKHARRFSKIWSAMEALKEVE